MTDTLQDAPLRERKSHLWARDQHDWYVEPRWVSERLFAVESFEGVIWEPACGIGRIVDSAINARVRCVASDLIDRAAGRFMAPIDFLRCNLPWPDCYGIVSNPPFKIAEAFVKHALELAPKKVAMLLPANWVQGDKRSRWLETTPLARVYFITPRPSMPPGTVVAAGVKPGNGIQDYAWFVWSRGHIGPADIRWLRRDV